MQRDLANSDSEECAYVLCKPFWGSECGLPHGTWPTTLVEAQMQPFQPLI